VDVTFTVQCVPERLEMSIRRTTSAAMPTGVLAITLWVADKTLSA